MAKEASRVKISAVQAISFAKSYSTTLADDHCSLSLQLPRPRALWNLERSVAKIGSRRKNGTPTPIAKMSLVRHLQLYIMLPAIFAACTCNQPRLLYNHASTEAFTLAH